MEIFTQSPEETKKFARKLGANLVKYRHKNAALVIALNGNLGSGKTTLVQGLANWLKVKGRVISPTFILMRRYALNNLIMKKSTVSLVNLYHLDFYRLEENIDIEIDNLGLAEILKNPKNIVVIEWAERIGKFLPKESTQITLENLGGNTRKILIT